MPELQGEMMSVPVAAEILRGAAREVEKGWCRGMVQSNDGDVCAIGALRRSAHVDFDVVLHGTAPEYGKAAKALADVFEEQYPDQSDPQFGYLRAPESIIWRYNDLVVPDKHAVVAAMEKAANNLEA